jgi:hypothetical protein
MFRRPEPWAALAAVVVVILMASAGRWLEPVKTVEPTSTVVPEDQSLVLPTVEATAMPTVLPTIQPTAVLEQLQIRLNEYGGVKPSFPESAIPLSVGYGVEGQPPTTTFAFSFDLPDGGPWDVEIRSFFTSSVGISSHNANNAFHQWDTNTNVVLWLLGQQPGAHTVSVTINDFLEPQNTTPQILWVDAFYKYP